MTDGTLRAGRARAGAGRRAVYQVTITAKGGGPVSAAVCRWLGLPEDWPAAERHFRAAGNASLRRHLDRFRHPGLDVSYRVTGSDGAPAGSAVRAVRCTDRWLRHDVDGRDLFVYEKPSGKNRFQVYERGAGRRGTARKRAGAASLPEALRLACTLGPSTPEEILAGVETGGEDDRRLVASLIRYSRPGTRLWVLPRCGEHGYQGTGQPATALGLAVIGVENHASPAPAGPASPTTSSSLPRHVSPRRPAWTRSRPKSTRFSSRTSAEAEPRGAPYAGL